MSLDDLKGSKSVIVFIPFAFTRTCESELCQIRDEYSMFDEADAQVVAITCNTLHANKVWSDQQGFQFDTMGPPVGENEGLVLARHRNEGYGYPERTTYFLDDDAVITQVTRSDRLGEARDFEVYRGVLG